MISSNQRRRTAARSLAVLARQAGSAASAAAIARRTSSTPRLGTVPTVSPVAGSVTVIVFLLSASIQLPPT